MRERDPYARILHFQAPLAVVELDFKREEVCARLEAGRADLHSPQCDCAAGQHPHAADERDGLVGRVPLECLRPMPTRERCEFDSARGVRLRARRRPAVWGDGATSATLVLATLLTVLCCSGARLECEPTPSASRPLPDPMPAGETWYGAYMHGQKVGYAHRVIRRSSKNGSWSTTWFAMLKRHADGQDVTTRTMTESQFAALPPHVLEFSRYAKQQGMSWEEVRVDRTARGHMATVSQAGEARHVPLSPIDYTLADSVGIVAWVRGKPAAGATLALQDFSTRSLMTDELLYTILLARVEAWEGVLTTTYDIGVRSRRQGEVGTRRMDERGRLLAAKFKTGYEIRLESEQSAKGPTREHDPLLAGYVSLDKPLRARREEVARLVLHATGERAHTLLAAPGQEVSDNPGGGRRITLLTGAARRSHATVGEQVESLRETVALPHSHPRVMALAHDVVGEANSADQKISKLLAFVATHVQQDSLAYERGLLELLNDPQGDCSEVTRLFVALARAAGVPAREVWGLMYVGDGPDGRPGPFVPHAWAEVVLDGCWVQVDPAWNQMEVDATHVCLARAQQVVPPVARGSLGFGLVEVVTRVQPSASR